MWVKLGSSFEERMADENRTKLAVDFREQIDIATELPTPGEDEPRYRQLRGPNMWPKEELIPGFRATVETYLEHMSALSTEFTALVGSQ
jgi:isopenicillin N synthase-like dioxygenase